MVSTAHRTTYSILVISPAVTGSLLVSTQALPYVAGLMQSVCDKQVNVDS